MKFAASQERAASGRGVLTNGPDEPATNTPAVKRFRVRYRHEQPGLCYGNILWNGKWPMFGGRFKPGHPVGNRANGASSSNDRAEMGESSSMAAFRARGYWASCFPEGDGITMRTERGQTPEQVAQDIRECFGWEVVIER